MPNRPRAGSQASHCEASADVSGQVLTRTQALLAFRGVVGIGLGGVPVVYTLFTEFCPTDRRGLWLVVLQARGPGPAI